RDAISGSSLLDAARDADRRLPHAERHRARPRRTDLHRSQRRPRADSPCRPGCAGRRRSRSGIPPVIRGPFRKESTMRSKFLLIALGSALAGCQTATGPDVPAAGLPAVNVPVVTSADYVFDAAAPGGTLAPGEADRLNGWFQGLGLGYGDSVYVDGGYSPAARAQIAAVAGRYGLMVSPGAPVTAGV